MVDGAGDALGDGGVWEGGTTADRDTGDSGGEEGSEDSGDEDIEDATGSVAVCAAILAHYTEARSMQSSALGALAGVYSQGAQDAAAKATCPHCGSAGKDAGLPHEVHIVTWDQPITINVQGKWCSACAMSYSAQPTVLGCIPDTDASWDITRQRGTNKLLWWTNSVVQLFDTLTFFTRHMSADRFCAAMLYNWEQNGSGTPQGITAGMLRKRLRYAWRHFCAGQALLEDLPEGIPGLSLIHI